jgi:hypothetical protein
MSTPLVILAAILAVFALVLIPLMMMKPNTEETIDHPHESGNQVKRYKKKKRR